jgi:hypothetical protein
VTGCIIDAAEVFAWCAKLFPFARSDAAAPATAITVGDMKQALFVLPITPFSFRTSWKRRSIATHRLGLRMACGSNEKSHPAERPRDLAIGWRLDCGIICATSDGPHVPATSRFGSNSSPFTPAVI